MRITEDKNQESEKEICIHIFSVSAAMVGVCVTVIGVFRALAELKTFSSIGDNLLAVDALIFLASCITAYFALRSKNRKYKQKIEKIADIMFLIGLSLMAIVCLLITYTFA